MIYGNICKHFFGSSENKKYTGSHKFFGWTNLTNVQHCNYAIHFRFEACWPAMAKDTHGAVFVYNPDVPNHDKELENW